MTHSALLVDIEKIGVVDDNEESRATLAYIVEDADLKPIAQDNPVTDLDSYLASLKDNFDAVVTDHHLRKVQSYFPINGAQLASYCYDLQIPSLLVTRYERPEIVEIRSFRENLPVVLTPDEYNTDTLIAGLEKCVNEFRGNISIGRKPWRTLIRIDEIKDEKNLYIIIPGWDSQQPIALNMNNLPLNLRKNIKPDMRLFAKVNIGNESSDELFIKDWEY